MGRSPKRKSQAKGIQPKQAILWSHHFHDDHEDFSHLLTSINWWSSQKEKTTQTEHTTNKRVS